MYRVSGFGFVFFSSALGLCDVGGTCLRQRGLKGLNVQQFRRQIPRSQRRHEVAVISPGGQPCIPKAPARPAPRVPKLSEDGTALFTLQIFRRIGIHARQYKPVAVSRKAGILCRFQRSASMRSGRAFVTAAFFVFSALTRKVLSRRAGSSERFVAMCRFLHMRLEEVFRCQMSHGFDLAPRRASSRSM